MNDKDRPSFKRASRLRLFKIALALVMTPRPDQRDAVARMTRRDRDRELCALGVRELGAAYRDGSLSPVEVIEATLRRSAQLNPAIGAYRAVLDESAMLAARTAELQLAAHVDLGPLHGIPVSVKDNIRVRGTQTLCGSGSLSVCPQDEEDAGLVRRLGSAGAIVIGKANCDEFACGTPDPEIPGATVQNPRKWGHRAGGSSSGSAAAVAAGLCVVSIGTDTGGSIRHPASLCGVVGLRPTHGLIPMRGVLPFSPQLDVAGPIARSTDDVGLALDVLAGHGRRDPHADAPPSSMESTSGELEGLRLGLPTNAMYRDGHESALAILDAAHAALVARGVTSRPIAMPRAEETIEVSTTVMLPDLKHVVEQYGMIAVGRDLSRRLVQAGAISTAQRRQAKAAMADIRRRWLDLFDQVDLIALPANLAGAPRQGEDTITIRGEPRDFREVVSGANRGASLAGIPALTVPIGAMDGLPIGIQLVGPRFSEWILLAAGRALERSLGNLPRRWGVDPVGVPGLVHAGPVGD